MSLGAEAGSHVVDRKVGNGTYNNIGALETTPLEQTAAGPTGLPAPQIDTSAKSAPPSATPTPRAAPRTPSPEGKHSAATTPDKSPAAVSGSSSSATSSTSSAAPTPRAAKAGAGPSGHFPSPAQKTEDKKPERQPSPAELLLKKSKIDLEVLTKMSSTEQTETKAAFIVNAIEKLITEYSVDTKDETIQPVLKFVTSEQAKQVTDLPLFTAEEPYLTLIIEIFKILFSNTRQPLNEKQSALNEAIYLILANALLPPAAESRLSYINDLIDNFIDIHQLSNPHQMFFLRLLQGVLSGSYKDNLLEIFCNPIYSANALIAITEFRNLQALFSTLQKTSSASSADAKDKEPHVCAEKLEASLKISQIYFNSLQSHTQIVIGKIGGYTALIDDHIPDLFSNNQEVQKFIKENRALYPFLYGAATQQPHYFRRLEDIEAKATAAAVAARDAQVGIASRLKTFVELWITHEDKQEKSENSEQQKYIMCVLNFFRKQVFAHSGLFAITTLADSVMTLHSCITVLLAHTKSLPITAVTADSKDATATTLFKFNIPNKKKNFLEYLVDICNTQFVRLTIEQKAEQKFFPQDHHETPHVLYACDQFLAKELGIAAVGLGQPPIQITSRRTTTLSRPPMLPSHTRASSSSAKGSASSSKSPEKTEQPITFEEAQKIVSANNWPKLNELLTNKKLKHLLTADLRQLKTAMPAATPDSTDTLAICHMQLDALISEQVENSLAIFLSSGHPSTSSPHHARTSSSVTKPPIDFNRAKELITAQNWQSLRSLLQAHSLSDEQKKQLKLLMVPKNSSEEKDTRSNYYACKLQLTPRAHRDSKAATPPKAAAAVVASPPSAAKANEPIAAEAVIVIINAEDFTQLRQLLEGNKLEHLTASDVISLQCKMTKQEWSPAEASRADHARCQKLFQQLQARKSSATAATEKSAAAAAAASSPAGPAGSPAKADASSSAAINSSSNSSMGSSKVNSQSSASNAALGPEKLDVKQEVLPLTLVAEVNNLIFKEDWKAFRVLLSTSRKQELSKCMSKKELEALSASMILPPANQKEKRIDYLMCKAQLQRLINGTLIAPSLLLPESIQEKDDETMQYWDSLVVEISQCPDSLSTDPKVVALAQKIKWAKVNIILQQHFQPSELLNRLHPLIVAAFEKSWEGMEKKQARDQAKTAADDLGATYLTLCQEHVKKQQKRYRDIEEQRKLLGATPPPRKPARTNSVELGGTPLTVSAQSNDSSPASIIEDDSSTDNDLTGWDRPDSARRRKATTVPPPAIPAISPTANKVDDKKTPFDAFKADIKVQEKECVNATKWFADNKMSERGKICKPPLQPSNSVELILESAIVIKTFLIRYKPLHDKITTLQTESSRIKLAQKETGEKAEELSTTLESLLEICTNFANLYNVREETFNQYFSQTIAKHCSISEEQLLEIATTIATLPAEQWGNAEVITAKAHRPIPTQPAPTTPSAAAAGAPVPASPASAAPIATPPTQSMPAAIIFTVAVEDVAQQLADLDKIPLALVTEEHVKHLATRQILTKHIDEGTTPKEVGERFLLATAAKIKKFKTEEEDISFYDAKTAQGELRELLDFVQVKKAALLIPAAEKDDKEEKGDKKQLLQLLEIVKSVMTKLSVFQGIVFAQEIRSLGLVIINKHKSSTDVEVQQLIGDIKASTAAGKRASLMDGKLSMSRSRESLATPARPNPTASTAANPYADYEKIWHEANGDIQTTLQQFQKEKSAELRSTLQAYITQHASLIKDTPRLMIELEPKAQNKAESSAYYSSLLTDAHVFEKLCKDIQKALNPPGPKKILADVADEQEERDSISAKAAAAGGITLLGQKQEPAKKTATVPATTTAAAPASAAPPPSTPTPSSPS